MAVNKEDRERIQKRTELRRAAGLIPASYPVQSRPPAQRVAIRIAALPCIHLGALTGETRPCKTCTKTVQEPLYSCVKHGLCAAERVVTLADGTPVKCCRICPDHEAR